MTEQLAAMRQALNKAFQLGQRYWSWADSEYSSHWKKADAAKAEFDKLIEDTIRTAIEQAETAQGQEPVAWVDVHDYTNLYYRKPAQVDVVPLYYAPPAQEFVCSTGLCRYRKPLTDEQREEIAKGWRGRNWTVGDIIDAIEKAHGITGETK